MPSTEKPIVVRLFFYVSQYLNNIFNLTQPSYTFAESIEHLDIAQGDFLVQVNQIDVRGKTKPFLDSTLQSLNFGQFVEIVFIKNNSPRSKKLWETAAVITMDFKLFHNQIKYKINFQLPVITVTKGFCEKCKFLNFPSVLQTLSYEYQVKKFKKHAKTDKEHKLVSLNHFRLKM